MKRRLQTLACVVLLALFAVVLCRTAWVGDDAYITFRTVDNLVHGYGARWNVDERVQAYTHPLWLLTLAALELATREPYFTATLVTIALSLAAAALLMLRIAHSTWQATLAILILTSARSFVDYSTSGLENPLSHLLIVGYLIALARSDLSDRPWVPVILASLTFTNRQDLMWLLGPSLAVYLIQNRSRKLGKMLAIGLTPIVAWEAFSLIYYGSLVPNTALAKVGTGVPAKDLVTQGIWYLRESWLHDPLTLVTIGASIAAPVILLILRAARGSALSRPKGFALSLAVGQCCYLAYVVAIGGDFMSGRFLTAPLLVAVAQLSALTISINHFWGVGLGAPLRK